MLVLAWRAGPGWIVLLNEDDEMHAVPYETITKPQSVRSKLRRAWMWRDTTNRPDEWWPQIVDLNSTGLACAVYRHRPAELRRAPACRRTSPAQRHTRISTFFIYQYPLDKIWHGTDQGNHQWQTETLTPPRHDSHRAGRLACAAYRSSLSVQRGLLRATLVLLVSALAVIPRQSIAGQTSDRRWWRRLRSRRSSGKRLPRRRG